VECWASILTLTIRTSKTAELSALRAGHTLPPRKFLGTCFFERLRGPQGYWMQTEETGHLETSKDRTGYWTQNLPSCVQCLNQLHQQSPPQQGRISIYGIVYGRMSCSPTSCACKIILCSRMYQIYHRKLDINCSLIVKMKHLMWSSLQTVFKSW